MKIVMALLVNALSGMIYSILSRFFIIMEMGSLINGKNISDVEI